MSFQKVKASAAAAFFLAAPYIMPALAEKPANDPPAKEPALIAMNAKVEKDPSLTDNATKEGLFVGQAQEYSMANPDLAIVILQGKIEEATNNKTGKPFTAQEMGEILVKKLSTKGIPPIPRERIKVFTMQTECDCVARFGYFLDGHILGGGLLEAKDAIDIAMIGAVSHQFELESKYGKWSKNPAIPLTASPSGRD